MATTRGLFIAWLLAAYGCVNVPGPGLHALVPCEAGAHHGEAGDASGPTDRHACPIVAHQWQAQGLAPAPASGVVAGEGSEAVAPPAPTACRRVDRGPVGSRAPPRPAA